MALPIFAITLFVSAFLLFLVQPMIGKMILPNLGGAPQVWNTCMVFFQTMLLAGYAYTHTISNRLKLRTQLIFHGGILLVPLLVFAGNMAYAISAYNEDISTGPMRGLVLNWIPPGGGNPILATLLLLTWVIGIPFFVVSTSAPLLQRWFAHTGHPAGKDPYFLYGASNLGSLLSLVSYPFLVERLVGLNLQTWWWIGAYVAMVFLYVVCVSFVWKAPPTVELAGEKEKEKDKVKTEETAASEEKKDKNEEKETGIAAGAPKKKDSISGKIRKGSKQRKKKPATPVVGASRPSAPKKKFIYEEVRSDVMTPWRRIRWVLLAFVPSSLMLGITTYISTDVSAITLFWMIPLSLYLLSFILVFSRNWENIVGAIPGLDGLAKLVRGVSWTHQPHTLMVISQPLVVLFFIFLVLTGSVSPIYRSVTFSIFAFFLTAMVCHGEMARDRPSPKHLTEFYLLMSVGGMLGGVFNALLAPVLFWGLAELPIALILACFMRPVANRLAPVDRPLMVVFCALLGLLFGFILLSPFSIIFGLLIGLGLGVVIGMVVNVEHGSDTWIERSLVNMFPGLGDWAHEKGQEMRQELAHKEPEEEPTKPRKRVIAHAAEQDLYVLSNILDFVLPICVLIFMTLMYTIPPSFVQTYLIKPLGLDNTGLDYANLLIALRLGLPVCVFALMFSLRPVRIGLTVALIFGLVAYQESRRFDDSTQILLTQTRSYFGRLRVIGTLEADPVYTHKTEFDIVFPNKEDAKHVMSFPVTLVSGDKTTWSGVPAPYTYLMHGTTHHGLNYQSPARLRRLATTYYHRKGPVGVIMERFDWFPGKQNTYKADNRFPVAIIGMAASPFNLGIIPDAQLVNLWSEPPYCCVGLGTGTMASYARPFQHMTFYEIDNKIRQFSLGKFPLPKELFVGDSATPEGRQGPYFNYVRDAIDRGGYVEIYMGDARISMKPRTEKLREQRRLEGEFGPWKETREGIVYQQREHYYHAMEIDAFSSDAIPVHLITKEAIQQYLDKLAPEGVILVHTSNRHVDLVKPVSDIAKSLGLEYRVVNCLGERRKRADGKYLGSHLRGHFQSEYVMLSRSFKGIARMRLQSQNPGTTPSSAEVQALAEKWEQEAHHRWQARLKQLLAGIPKTDDFMRSEMEKVWNRDACVPNATSSEMMKKYNIQFTQKDAELKYYQTWVVEPAPGNPLWTDDFSDMISVFRWGFGH